MYRSILPGFLALLISTLSISQNVGIGTTNPLARLHVADGSIVFSVAGEAPPTQGNPPISGAGRRMMWYADKAAFRVGYVEDQQWDQVNVGNYSFASGFSSQARGMNAVAMGAHSAALGESSIALGQNSLAGGRSSISLGYLNNATNLGSVALGYHTQASGIYSTSFGFETFAGAIASVAGGYQTHATGDYSTALGNTTTASGTSSVAVGDNVVANGNYSIALGSYVSTSNFSGCLTIGDRSTTTVMSTFVANGFRARFAGGYRLFTNSAVTIGAFLNADANSWAALSDARMKENFLPVDGEAILHKISGMQQYTWNYKGQDVKKLRHYGPMGQDFYEAFGKDALGEIGCDTLINQQDFLGVNFIAIQALEKRTQEINVLKELIVEMRKELDELKRKKGSSPALLSSD